MLDIPNGFSAEVNDLIFKYIWKYKNPKLKKTTITKSKNEGGLNMIDFTLFDKALKITAKNGLCPSKNRFDRTT